MIDDGLYVPLADGDLRLEPLEESHREALRAATAADEDIWPIYSVNYAGADFDPAFDALLCAQPGRRGYAVWQGERVIGMTAWIERGPVGQAIEIGNTYIVPEVRGTGLNGRLKRMMIGHAFACGLQRIEFRIDERNGRSGAAVLRLGAVKEGVIEAERVTWNGHVRDTGVFAIHADDWPKIRDQG